MSTNDVPGAKKEHNDHLHVGCWAESSDECYIFVKGTEGGIVTADMYDMNKPISQFQFRMPESQFMSEFSWQPGSQDSTKWTWHDKSEMPWERLIGMGLPDGEVQTDPVHILSSADRVAKRVKAHKIPLTNDDLTNAHQKFGQGIPEPQPTVTPDVSAAEYIFMRTKMRLRQASKTVRNLLKDKPEV